VAKYDELRHFLARTKRPIEMTFDHIANLVGGLPPSAYEHRAWWSNNLDHVQAQAWMRAGRRVDWVNILRRRVRFS
jgi:hypothetical protein